MNVLFSSGSLCTASGAGQLYCTYYGVLGVDQFKAFKVEVTYLKRFAKTEVVDVDDKTFGDVGVDGFNFEFLH